VGKWTIMGTAEEREAFWRTHHEAWRRRNLNQREYCEAHGLVLKRFENWRVKFRDEPEVPRKLLYRRGLRPSHMTSHLVGLPLAYFSVRRVGDSVARVRELENIRQFLTGQTLTIGLDVVFASIFVVVMWLYSWQLTVIVLVAIPFWAAMSDSSKRS
jgi:hypothetical protein